MCVSSLHLQDWSCFSNLTILSIIPSRCYMSSVIRRGSSSGIRKTRSRLMGVFTPILLNWTGDTIFLWVNCWSGIVGEQLEDAGPEVTHGWVCAPWMIFYNCSIWICFQWSRAGFCSTSPRNISTDKSPGYPKSKIFINYVFIIRHTDGFKSLLYCCSICPKLLEINALIYKTINIK